ncbi:F-box/LRR-repeat protein 8-like [Actinia tenebrosa]|uniref:F-box/LRR-repeat protein 8 n=1 Tax=Actinia tenebrosa TaxID=6105 RepID=A0A6P8J6P5_ACTTE|nr:F-box/LRR-repeat protein 8-like [Actinia tenebrosa]
MEHKSWADLPEHVIVSIFSYTSIPTRSKLALVCKSWLDAFKSPFLWHSFTFQFLTPEDFKYEPFLHQHGQYLRSVYIRCNQEDKVNRENACKLIRGLYELEKQRLERLKINFTGENPLFYAGQEFVECLRGIFGSPPTKVETKNVQVLTRLKSVDLRGLPVALNDELLLCLAEHNAETLEYLDIQNASLVCKVTASCILKLVRRCRKLKSLATHYGNITEEILLSFIEEGRSPLSNLSVLCRREEKYGRDISSETWSTVRAKLPNLRVTLYFDLSCPMFKVNAILKPEIPVSYLRLLVQARLVQQVYFATQYYSKTLEKIALSTTNSPELENALLHLSSACNKLNEIHVFQCYVSSETKVKILKMLPNLKKYTLKTKE